MYKSSEALTDHKGNFPDELLYGRVGCLFSLLFMKQTCSAKVEDVLITKIAKAIIESGKHLADKIQREGSKAPPLMFEWHNTKYLGPAHGMAGIIYLLLQVSLSPHFSLY